MFAKTSRLVQLISSLCVLVAFASCSNLQQGKRLEDDEQTLRALTTEMARYVPWTDELESERLTANIGLVEGIARSVAISPLSYIAKEDADTAAIYPFLEDFGSLDTTLIEPEVKTVLDNFCTAINRAQNADMFMARGCVYQLALFYRDVALEKPDLSVPENPAETTDQEATFTFFDSYFYGQPYMTGSMYEIPVRFVGKTRSLDVLLFLLKEGGSWKIDELQILKAEQSDGGE